MPGLKEVGRLNYNGYEFEGASTVTVSTTPVEDDAQRTTVYLILEINVETIITPETVYGTDPDMENIRQRLCEHGRPLIFVNRGFGSDLYVNTGTNPVPGQVDSRGAIRDVKWGPKPKILRWDSVGSNQACHVVWSVTTCLPCCDRFDGIMAFNYEIDYAIDQHGDTTRTISGYYEIAQTWRLAPANTERDRTLQDTADAYWEQLTVQVPLEFQRRKTRHLSLDKSRMNFSIIDTQIPSPNAYPTGATAIEGRHRASWNRQGAQGAKHRHTIDMTITPLRGISGADAWIYFVRMVQKRIKNAKDKSQFVMIDTLDAEDNLFGRPVAFRAGFQVIKNYPDFLSFDLWQPLDTDWKLWRTSMEGTAYSARGTAGLQHFPTQDAIVDLCESSPYLNIGENEVKPKKTKPGKLQITNDTPPLDQSYLQYDCWLSPVRDQPVVRQAYLQPPESEGEEEHNDDDYQNMNGSMGFSAGQVEPPNAIPDTIQKRGRARYSVALVGRAIRAGYPIRRPMVKKLGGQDAVETSGGFAQKHVGDFLGVPVYKAAWNIHYVAAGAPGQVDPRPAVNEDRPRTNSLVGGGIGLPPPPSGPGLDPATGMPLPARSF